MRYAFLFVLVAIILIALAAFFMLQPPPMAATQQTGGTAISVSTSTITDETSVYSIHADYPVFGIPALDAKIKQTIDTGIADIKSTDANPSPNNIQNEFESTFDDVYIGDDIVSVKLLLSQYTGGAHNNSIAIGINYDRATGTFLTLDQALSLTGKTLSEVSELAKSSLTSDFESVQFPEGAAPTPDNYSTFVINKNSVTFIFQEYQVEAYAAGQPEVSIPRIK